MYVWLSTINDFGKFCDDEYLNIFIWKLRRLQDYWCFKLTNSCYFYNILFQTNEFSYLNPAKCFQGLFFWTFTSIYSTNPSWKVSKRRNFIYLVYWVFERITKGSDWYFYYYYIVFVRMYNSKHLLSIP